MNVLWGVMGSFDWLRVVLDGLNWLCVLQQTLWLEENRNCVSTTNNSLLTLEDGWLESITEILVFQ